MKRLTWQSLAIKLQIAASLTLLAMTLLVSVIAPFYRHCEEGVKRLTWQSLAIKLPDCFTSFAVTGGEALLAVTTMAVIAPFIVIARKA